RRAAPFALGDGGRARLRPCGRPARRPPCHRPARARDRLLRRPHRPREPPVRGPRRRRRRRRVRRRDGARRARPPGRGHARPALGGAASPARARRHALARPQPAAPRRAARRPRRNGARRARHRRRLRRRRGPHGDHRLARARSHPRSRRSGGRARRRCRARRRGRGERGWRRGRRGGGCSRRGSGHRANQRRQDPGAGRRRRMNLWREAALVAGKDLRIESRSRVTLYQVLPFGLIVVLLFAFALDPSRGVLSRVAPGLFWVAVLLAALLAVARSFAVETETAARDALRLWGLDPAAVFLGKAGAIAAQLAVLEVALGVGVALLYDVELRSLGLLVAAAAPATAGIAATG